MRTLLAVLALSAGHAGLSSLSACTTNPNSPAIKAMDDPVNACGPGGTSGDCSSGRR
ncbi:MAG: hypothetical protein J0H57_27195 [Rhodospirillales bacterium]|nr:hypothetical protein [Rhodospirillales bacterium]